ncbi:hypothetical protein [Bosea sp. (in: a-proteobacteria)]|jgi:hypothetical protein|uniref:hypothetical protein n=1 Tax=Bosea sp. (in: a-proteobacteria) TaxID=1871050 RepID=UPI002DDD6692|nr:hypothetical protein [Bosea sp. (in: a-proteobacteria)]HEV2509677.1 hypothetical protein [Bosea sp. (in: a-proteobacteria)]
MDPVVVFMLLGWGETGHTRPKNMNDRPISYNYMYGTEESCWDGAKVTLQFFPKGQFACVKVLVSKQEHDRFLKEHTVSAEEVERLARKYGPKAPGVRP